MRHPRHLAAVPALALLVAVAFAGGATAQAAPPNLAITSFAGPACAEIGEVIGGQITITMINNGEADLPAAPDGSNCANETENTCAAIGFYIRDPVTGSESLLSGGREFLSSVLGDGVAFKKDDTVSNFLYSGASVAAGSPTGNVLIGAFVDEFDIVTELHEDDNKEWRAIQIFPAGSGGCNGQLPDLVIDSFTHQPANPTTADQITLTAVVKNAGSAGAEPSVACIDVGGEICTNPTDEMLYGVPALAVGETFEVTRSVNLEVAQNYINNAVADLGDDVIESNEGNNTASDSFTVTQAQEAVALVYQITSLPEYGTLEDLDGCSVQTPCNLPSVVVTYLPAAGFVGTDSFEFQVLDPGTGLTSQAASIGIFVADILDLFDTPLTVDFQGSGRGDVTMDIGGTVVAICDDDCTKEFSDGQLVKLQARPIDEYTFVGWGGACIVSSQNSQIASLILPTEGATCTATFGP